MVKHRNDDIADAENVGTLDPYTLAARYHHQFTIHPFGVGSSEMSGVVGMGAESRVSF